MSFPKAEKRLEKKPPFLSLKVAPNRVIHQTWCYCNKVLWIVDGECCCCPEHRAPGTLILHSDVNLQPAGEISQCTDFIHISFLELFPCVALPFLAEFSCNTALLAPGESAAPCLLRFGYCVNQQGKGCVCWMANMQVMTQPPHTQSVFQCQLNCQAAVWRFCKISAYV